MVNTFSDARKRQLARLGGIRPPAARAAIALAKSQAYQDAGRRPSHAPSLRDRSCELQDLV